MKNRTLVTRDIGGLLISRQNKETPSDAEWDEFLEAVVTNRERAALVKILVMTEGGGPSVVQRKRLEQALDRRTFRVAVVTDSIKVRFIVSSVALLNRDISSFARSDIRDAYRYLDLSMEQQQRAETTLAELGRLLAKPV